MLCFLNGACKRAYLLSTAAGGEVPDRLMQVMLPIIGSEVCSEPEWYGGFLDDSMVCAGYEEGERGTCNVSYHCLVLCVYDTITTQARIWA